MTALDTKHTFTVTIDGTDCSGWVVDDTFRAQSILTYQIDTLDFDLKDHDGNLPTIIGWNEVVVTDESAGKVFAGYITRYRESVDIDDSVKIVRCYCQDYTCLLKTKTVSTDYHGQTDEATLDALFTTYLSEITTTNVTASSGNHDFVFDDVTLFDAVQSIAQRTGSQWYIDYAKDLHYWDGTSVAAAYSLVAHADANYTTTFPWVDNSLWMETDVEDMANKIIVRGGVSETAVTTEQFSGDGATVEFYVANRPIRRVVEILIGTTRQAFDTDFAWDNFADANSRTVDCLVSYHRGRIRWDGADPPPVGTNNITIRYTSDSTVAVTRQDLVSQAAYRVIEKIIVNRDIATVAEAEKLGDEYLARLAYGTRHGRVTTRRYGLKSGDMLPISCSVLDLGGADTGYGIGGYGSGGYGTDEFLIQSARTTIKAGWVVQDLELQEVQPTIGDLIRKILKNEAGDGGILGGFSGGAGLLDRVGGGGAWGGGGGGGGLRIDAFGGTVIIGTGAAPLLIDSATTCYAESVIIGLEAAHAAVAADGFAMNVVIGGHAGYELSGGTENVYVGYCAGYHGDDCTGNVLIGSTAGADLADDCDGNTMVGWMAGAYAKYVEYCTLIGEGAGFYAGDALNDGSNCYGITAVGLDAGRGASGSNYICSTLIGDGAGVFSHEGSFNTDVGYYASLWNRDGSYNSILGTEAGAGGGNNVSNYSNAVLLGYRAGYALLTAADNNILIGFQCGDNITSGASNLLIGHNIDAASATGSNQLSIGNILYGTLGATGNLTVNAVTVSAHYDLMLAGDGVLGLKETTTPTADAGYGKVYTKDTNKLFFQDGAGVEHEVQLVA